MAESDALPSTVTLPGPEHRVVLIVSEEYALIRTILKAGGYATAGLPDQESARDLFNAVQPALVIADFELTSGRRSLAHFVRILSRFPRTPMLAIVDREESVARQALREDFDDICSKPIVSAVLQAKVRRLAGAPPPLA